MLTNIAIVHEERQKQRQNSQAVMEDQMASMGISRGKSPEKAPPMPPRRAPVATSPTYESDEADNDPFGDGNALQTPAVEKDEPRWYVTSH